MSNYTEKNERIVNALRSGEEYVVLEAENDYYTLFQVESDRIPLPILIEIMGEDAVMALHKPALTIDRNTFVSSQQGDLLKDMVQAMTDSIDDDPDGKGFWRIIKGVLHVTTLFSRDDNRSRNGGDYHEYRLFSVHNSGVFAVNEWSCEISPMSEYGIDFPSLYRLDIKDLDPVLDRAEAVIKSIQAGEKIPACPTCGKAHDNQL